MSPAYRPISPGALIDRLAASIADCSAGYFRVALDGPPCARPDTLAASLLPRLELRGRPAVHLRAEFFWRDASLRLEYGHHDVEALGSWLDADALRREVLDPVLDSNEYLPSLRDPGTNRSTREPARRAEPGTVLIVSGALLLGRGLPFDRTIHLAVSPAARARRFHPDEAWTLPAYDDYDATVRPVEVADIVIRMDDPLRPAERGL